MPTWDEGKEMTAIGEMYAGLPAATENPEVHQAEIARWKRLIGGKAVEDTRGEPAREDRDFRDYVDDLVQKVERLEQENKNLRREVEVLRHGRYCELVGAQLGMVTSE